MAVDTPATSVPARPSPEFLGRGLSFPPRPRGGRLRIAEGPEKVQQSIWLILGTAPGERPMRPDFGCGIHDLVFMPNSESLRTQVRDRVRDALVRHEPRIDVTDVRVEAAGAVGNQLLVHIDYRVRPNNAVFNMVYPFYFDEGVGA